jgi:uncharacterized protein (DUF58 family)
MRLRLPAQARIWTRRAAILMDVGIVLFWLGIALQNGRLVVASALIFSYILLTLSFSLSPTKSLTMLRRLGSDRILEDQAVKFSSEVKNESRNTALVQVTEYVPDGLHVAEGGVRAMVIVASGAKATVRNVLKADFRGHYVLPVSEISSTDEFGLREEGVASDKVAYLSVLPPVEDLSDFSLDSRTAQPEIGTFHSSSVGVGTEFFGIRDYLPGDEFRRINWKASARTFSLLSNEYEREHVTNVYLLVDLTAHALDALKWTIRTSASIATYLLRTRNRLGLIVLGESTSHVQIESGRRQLLRVLDKLVTAEPGGTGDPSTYLLRLLEEMPRCEIIFVSTLSSDSISRSIVAIKGKRERLSVITRIPSVPEVEAESIVTSLATLMLTVKRRAIIQQIKNAEVRVIEVPQDRSIRSAVSMIRERPLRH